jgi:hypothetical protein
MIHVTERILDPAKTIAVEAFSIWLQDFSTARDSAPYSRSTIAEATTWSVKTSVQSPQSRLRQGPPSPLS